MPVSLAQLVQDIVAAYIDAKKDAAKLKVFAQKVSALIELLNQVAVAADGGVRDVDSLITIDEGTDLSQFFLQVGEALVAGQEHLDQRSMAYNASRDSSTIPPTLFAIPNVKAEMKLGFSQLHGSGINVVLFQNSDQKQRYAESTITFEVAAAPAPPNAQRLGESSQPRGQEPVATPPALSAEGGTRGSVQLESLPRAEVAEPVARGMQVERPARQRIPEFAPEAVKAREAVRSGPLREAAKSEVIKLLSDALTPSQSKFLKSRNTNVSILPPTKESKPTDTYLVLAASAGPGATPKVVQAYYGQASSMAFLPNYAKFSYPEPVRETKGLIVPVREVLGPEDPKELRQLVRNFGDVLVLALQFARNNGLFDMLDAESRKAEVIKKLAKQKAKQKNILEIITSADGVFHDSHRKLDIVLYVLNVEHSTNWAELHAGWIPTRGRPHFVSIPRTAELGKMPPVQLLDLLDGLKKVLRDLLLTFENA